MLSIEIGGRFVDYLDNISIEITDNNPLFSDSLFNDAYSYAFNLPLSPRNFSVLSGNEDEKLVCTIKHSGLVYIQGFVKSIKESSQSFQVNIVEQSIDVRQLAEKTDISELDLVDVTVCDIEDTPLEKIDKWYAHMRQTITEGVENGTHKFPKIFTRGYNDPDAPPLNEIHKFNGGIVNAYSLSEYLKNTEVPNTYLPDEKNWYTTVAPCPRIEYVFNKVCEYLGIKKIVGEIYDIPEFKQMVSFAGYVLDRLEYEATKNYNTHGLSFKLEDFLPELKMIEVFKLLNETFGAYFVMKGNRLNVLLRNSVIRKKPVDLSKYASSSFFNELASTYMYAISYAVDIEEDLYYGQEYSDYQIPVPRVYPYNTIEYGTGNEDVSIVKNHVPMVCSYFSLSGTWITFSDYQSGQDEDQYGYNEFSSSLGYRGLIKSDEFPDEKVDKAKVFHLGLVRGVYPTKKLNYDEFGAIISEEPIDHLYFMNYNQLPIADDTLANFSSYLLNFGESSIYHQYKDNIFDLRHAKYFDFLKDYREVTKSLNIPGHVINSIRSWQDPHHLIKQRNMSFQGFVKSITFRLTKTRISPAEITYLVKNDSRK